MEPALLNRRNFLRATTASTIGLVAGVQATAAEPQYTWIYVKDMHCLHCAKTIARKLYTVPGVVKVQAYLKQHIAVITPQSGKSVSPRTVWEAIEQIKFQPFKLRCPNGTYTKKPAA
ncbi:MAG: heavy-metal-associated domain-containing protein [Pirellulales bacterium]